MSFTERINKLKAERSILEDELRRKQDSLKEAQEEMTCADEARAILQAAAQVTQKNLEVHFSDLVTKAFRIVFDDPYIFLPEFVERRNQTECDLWFVKNDKKLRPRFAAGHGVLDVASFALQLAYWKLEKGEPVIINDEPFRHLSRSLIPRAVEMIRMLSNEFGLQIIMVSHIDEIADAADKVFSVNKGKVS